MCANILWGQAGVLTMTTPVQSTGSTFTFHETRIKWNNIFQNQNVQIVKIYIKVDDAACINTTRTLQSVHAHLRPYTTIGTDNVIRIEHDFSPNTTTLNTNYGTLMKIYFEAIPASNVNFTIPGSPFPTNANIKANGTTYGIDISGFATTFQMPAPFAVGGVVQKPSGSASSCNPPLFNNQISGVTMTYSAFPGLCFPLSNPGSQLSTFGDYVWNLPRTYGYTITPSKTGTDWCCGVEGYDVARARELLIQNPTVDLFQYMAGDFNGDGLLSSFDILLMTKCSEGTFDYNNEAPNIQTNSMWRFIPATDYVANDPWSSNSTGGLPSSINISSLNSNVLNADFIGVKRGDIDQSCSDCGGNLIGGPEERGAEARIQAFTNDQSIEAGQEIWIPIYSSEGNQLAVMLLNMAFDKDFLEVKGIEKGGLSDTYQPHSIGQNGAFLRYGWFNLTKGGETLADDEPAFVIRAKAKQSAPSLEGLLWQEPNPKGNKLYYQDGHKSGEITFAVKTQEGTGFTATLVGSNPTVSNSLRVLVKGANTSEIESTLILPTGQPVQHFRHTLSNDTGVLDIPNIPDMAGVFTLLLKSPQGLKTIRFSKF